VPALQGTAGGGWLSHLLGGVRLPLLRSSATRTWATAGWPLRGRAARRLRAAGDPMTKTVWSGERSILGGLRGRAAAAWWLAGRQEDDSSQAVLELALIWGDQILDAGQLDAGEVTIGDAPGCTVAAPIEGRHVLA